MEIILGIAAYLIVGGIVMAIAEERDWLELWSLGYIIFPFLWLPIVLVMFPYILVKLWYRRNE
jgi:hypothetical protein